jgi:hypothetical protein
MHLMAHLALGIALLLVGYAPGPSAAGKPADADLAAIRMRKELGLSLKLEVPTAGPAYMYRLHTSLLRNPLSPRISQTPSTSESLPAARERRPGSSRL